MSDVVSASFRFPTVVFTVLVGIMLGLWVLSLLGVFDVTGGEGGDGFLDDVLEPIGLAHVPITVVLSIVALLGWFVSVLAHVFFLDDASGAALVIGAVVVGLVAAGAGIGVAVVAGPALSHVFETAQAPSGRDLVGRRAEIRSGTVSTTSGYADASWADGSVSRVEVRIPEHGDVAPDDLHAGDVVLLVDWNEPANTYSVSPLPAELR